MDNRKLTKNIAVLAAPLLLFVILFVPYSYANQHYIVEWLGCGCPKIDALGNYVSPDFNANDFTALFWTFISICVTFISTFLSVRIPKGKTWLRILYVVCIFTVSMLTTYEFCQIMMWN